jgi:hypothetical protein
MKYMIGIFGTTVTLLQLIGTATYQIPLVSAEQSYTTFSNSVSNNDETLSSNFFVQEPPSPTEQMTTTTITAITESIDESVITSVPNNRIPNEKVYVSDLLTTTASETTTHDPSEREQHMSQQQSFLRGRQLPGNDYNFDSFDFTSAEAGFAVGLSFFVIVIILLLCCCCAACSGGGGGRRYGGGGSSCLWDLVAIVCLWELCCDNDGVMNDGFMRF